MISGILFLALIGAFVPAAHSADGASYVNEAIVKWDAAGDAASFILQVADRKDQLVLENKTVKKELTLDLPPGRYRYRLRSIDSRGIQGPWTPYRDFEIAQKIEGGKSIRYTIFIEPGYQAEGSRLRFSGGLGLTYFAYQESPLGVSVNTLGPTLKLSAAYQIVFNVLDLGVIGFTTLGQSLSASPAGEPPPTIYGLNIRLGYRLPIEKGPLIWSIAAGAYLWGMSVPADAYGAGLITGPQLFASARTKRDGSWNYLVYVKFAAVSDAPVFSVASRELAFGAGVQLPKLLTIPHPLVLSFDFANTEFKSQVYSNRFSSNSLSLGILYGF